MITLFRCSTGEDWQLIMFDLMEDKVNSNNHFLSKTHYFAIEYAAYAIPFMISYIIFIKYVMLNLFILVLIEQFSTS